MSKPIAPSTFRLVIMPANTVTRLVDPSVTRTAITIQPPADTIFISPSPAVTSATGMAITPQFAPTQFCRCHQGTFVTDALYAITQTGQAVAVIESFVPMPEGDY